MTTSRAHSFCGRAWPRSPPGAEWNFCGGGSDYLSYNQIVTAFSFQSALWCCELNSTLRTGLALMLGQKRLCLPLQCSPFLHRPETTSKWPQRSIDCSLLSYLVISEIKSVVLSVPFQGLLLNHNSKRITRKLKRKSLKAKIETYLYKICHFVE